MFSSKLASNPNRFARLQLERLETRDCPAGLTLLGTAMPDCRFLLSGQISDGPNEVVYIQFSGSVHGGTWTDESGAYSCEVTASSVDPIYATGWLDGLDVTGPAEFEFTNSAPQIAFTTVSNENTTFWTINGTVTDEFAEGMIVHFGGIRSLRFETATVEADGTFSLTVSIPAEESDLAGISVVTTDCWGVESNTACTILL
jgi:hypothetical protein